MPHRPGQPLSVSERQRGPNGVSEVAAARPPLLDEDPSARALQEILLELKAMRGDTESLGPRAAVQNVRDHLTSSKDLSSALTNALQVVSLGTHLTFLNIPNGLTSLTVRLRTPDSPAIDVLAAGSQIRTVNPFSRIYITTVPALSGKTLSFVSGMAEVVHAGREKICIPKVDTVRCGRETHTMVGNKTLNWAFPAVPAGEMHRYREVSIGYDGADKKMQLLIITNCGELVIANTTFGSNRIGMLSASDTNTSKWTEGHGPVDIFAGENLQLRSGEALALGTILTLDYRYEILPPARVVEDDTQTITPTET